MSELEAGDMEDFEEIGADAGVNDAINKAAKIEAKVNDKRRIDPSTLEMKEAIFEDAPAMTKKARQMTRNINAQRMEVINAFVAKYGCQPDECEQVVQQTPGGVKWYIVLKENLPEQHFKEVCTICGEKLYAHISTGDEKVKEVNAVLEDWAEKLYGRPLKEVDNG